MDSSDIALCSGTQWRNAPPPAQSDARHLMVSQQALVALVVVRLLAELELHELAAAEIQHLRLRDARAGASVRLLAGG